MSPLSSCKLHSKMLMASASVICGISLVCLLGAARAANLDEIKARGFMISATEDNYPPFEFVKDGVPMGLDHELLALLQKEAPFKIRSEILPWQGLLAGVATGQYDVAISAGVITEERTKTLTFAEPIAPATSTCVIRANDDRVKTVADLNGLTIGTQLGSSLFQELPQLAEMLKKSNGTMGKVVQYPSFPEAYQDLLAGRTDIVVNTTVAIADVVRQRPDKFKACGFPVSQSSYHAWAVARSNTQLRDYLSAFIDKLRQSGKLAELQKKWLGEAFPDLPHVGLLPGDRPMPN